MRKCDQRQGLQDFGADALELDPVVEQLRVAGFIGDDPAASELAKAEGLRQAADRDNARIQVGRRTERLGTEAEKRFIDDYRYFGGDGGHGAGHLAKLVAREKTARRI